MNRFLKTALVLIPILVGIPVISWQHTVKPLAFEALQWVTGQQNLGLRISDQL